MGSTPFSAIYPDGPATQGAAGTGGAIGAGGNDQYPGMPAGATPIHRDLVITAATTGTAIWSPSSGSRFVLASANLSTDTAMRVALVDGQDIQGNRPVDDYFGANAGSSPNLVPVPYPSKAVGQPLLVVTGANGNVRVRVSGWEVQG